MGPPSARGQSQRTQRTGGKKARTPYNKHVQRFRQEKFYDRKKALSRFRRYCKFEEKNNAALQQNADAVDDESSRMPEVNSLIKRLVQDGRDAVDADYEDRLNLSFGGKALADEPTVRLKRPRKASLRQPEVVDEKPQDKDADKPDGRAVRRKKRRPEQPASPAKQAPDRSAPQETVRSSERTSVKKGQGNLASSKRKSSQQDHKSQCLQSSRYAKAWKDYEVKRKAIEAEKDKRNMELRARNRQRREGAKQRALKGQLLAKQTQRGQPRMQSILEVVTRKLQQK